MLCIPGCRSATGPNPIPTHAVLLDDGGPLEGQDEGRAHPGDLTPPPSSCAWQRNLPGLVYGAEENSFPGVGSLLCWILLAGRKRKALVDCTSASQHAPLTDRTFVQIPDCGHEPDSTCYRASGELAKQLLVAVALLDSNEAVTADNLQRRYDLQKCVRVLVNEPLECAAARQLGQRSPDYALVFQAQARETCMHYVPGFTMVSLSGCFERFLTPSCLASRPQGRSVYIICLISIFACDVLAGNRAQHLVLQGHCAGWGAAGLQEQSNVRCAVQ